MVKRTTNFCGIYCTEKGNKMSELKNATQYFIYGNTRIKITEHFPDVGNTLNELLADVIQYAAKADT